jgi:hypothetical protein
MRFVPDWYRSVARQSDLDFDLWVGLDGVGSNQVYEALNSHPHIQWVHGVEQDTPARIRCKAIAQMADAYDGIIFVDSDDLLCRTRVEAARHALRESDVVACALKIIGEDGTDMGLVFGPSAPDDAARMLPHRNVFGMSNTVYRTSVLKRCLPVPDECELVDWLLATRAWSLDARLGFEPTPRMMYRQYGDNIARVIGPYTISYVMESTRRVLHHYRCLLDSRWALNEAVRWLAIAAQKRVQAFQRSMLSSASIRERYSCALNDLPPQHVWWWIVANADLEDIWNQ